MKFCSRCGAKLTDAATYCPSCGTAVAQPGYYQAPQNPNGGYQNGGYQGYQNGGYYPNQPQQVYNQGYQSASPSGLQTAAMVMMVIGTVISGFSIIPLAWCIPMTISYWNKVKSHRPVGIGLKICSLLFVSLVGGILMLCDGEL